MSELIRKSDALAALRKHAKGETILGGQTYQSLTLETALDAIASLPAVTVAVKPLQDLLEAWVELASHCTIQEGVCCCGDNMEGHSNPMNCGHSPVDHGAYIADHLVKRTLAALEPVAAPDPAAIREAALREARQRVNDLVAERQSDLHGARNDFNRGAVDALQEACAAILALIPKGAAE